jgi:hypothetical protein
MPALIVVRTLHRFSFCLSIHRSWRVFHTPRDRLLQPSGVAYRRLLPQCRPGTAGMLRQAELWGTLYILDKEHT